MFSEGKESDGRKWKSPGLLRARGRVFRIGTEGATWGEKVEGRGWRRKRKRKRWRRRNDRRSEIYINWSAIDVKLLSREGKTRLEGIATHPLDRFTSCLMSPAECRQVVTRSSQVYPR